MLDIYRLEKEGINYREAIEKLGRDQGRFKELLYAFDTPRRGEDIIISMKAKDYQAAYQAAYELELECNNLAMTALFVALYDFCDAVKSRNEDDIQRCYDVVRKEYINKRALVDCMIHGF